MAHFAELDDDNKVLRIVVISNEDILDENGNESEFLGKDLCKKLFNGGKWIQTSFNGAFRKQYAGVGGSYDKDNDLFIAPKPFDSWILDENFDWSAPIEYPSDGKNYYWDEDQVNWVEVPEGE